MVHWFRRRVPGLLLRLSVISVIALSPWLRGPTLEAAASPAALDARPDLVGAGLMDGARLPLPGLAGMNLLAAEAEPCPYDPLPGQPCEATSGPSSAASPALGSAEDCELAKTDGSDRQRNLRAGLRRVSCGLEAGGGASGGDSDASPRGSGPAGAGSGPGDAPFNLDALVNNATADTSPHVTQSETFVWGKDSSLVGAAYNSSTQAPTNYSGYSYSTNGGTSWTEIRPSPFRTGHGTNFGDPTLVYNQKLGKWFATFLASNTTSNDCGSIPTGAQGIGLWESTDGINWTAGLCVVASSSADRQSMWVDNNPSSSNYGRMYVAYNNFDVGNGAVIVRRSDTGTGVWTPVTLIPGTDPFTRQVQVVGAQDGTGTVTVTTENPGNFAAVVPRTHYIHVSTNGGVSYSQVTMAASQAGPGVVLGCGRPGIAPIWRYEGPGQQAVGPGGVMTYVYTLHGAGGDLADIYYVRSTNNGSTWSAPVKLNDDGGTKEQWMPTIASTANGTLVASWYDRRNTTNGTNYQRVASISYNNGGSFEPNYVMSDVLIPQPAQPDPNVVSCYAGDYDYWMGVGNTIYGAWNDGRIVISGQQQQDVRADHLTGPVNFSCLTAGHPNGQLGQGYAANAYGFAYQNYIMTGTTNAYYAQLYDYYAYLYAIYGNFYWQQADFANALNYWYYSFTYAYYGSQYAYADYSATGSLNAYYAYVYGYYYSYPNNSSAYSYTASYC